MVRGAETAEGIAVPNRRGEVSRIERRARIRLEQAVRMLPRTRLGGRQRKMPDRSRAFHAERDAPAESSGEHSSNRPQPSPRCQFPAFDTVPAVAGPQLVSAVTR